MTGPNGEDEGSICQLALCTSDMATTVRRMTEVFGLLDSGAHVVWGPPVGALQGIKPDATVLLWWMVARKPAFQLELFRHSLPEQRPAPAGAAERLHLGWSKWGLEVADLDAVVAALRTGGLRPVDPVTFEGTRYSHVDDPETATRIELVEGVTGDSDTRDPRREESAAGTHVSLVVADLAAAGAFYSDALGLKPATLDRPLRAPQPDAVPSLALAAGPVVLELLEVPSATTRHPDVRLSDQGIMNVAFAFYDPEAREEVIRRVQDRGGRLNHERFAPHTAVYMVDPWGNSFELTPYPTNREENAGFIARPDFPPKAYFKQS